MTVFVHDEQRPTHDGHDDTMSTMKLKRNTLNHRARRAIVPIANDRDPFPLRLLDAIQ